MTFQCFSLISFTNDWSWLRRDTQLTDTQYNVAWRQITPALHSYSTQSCTNGFTWLAEKVLIRFKWSSASAFQSNGSDYNGIKWCIPSWTTQNGLGSICMANICCKQWEHRKRNRWCSSAAYSHWIHTDLQMDYDGLWFFRFNLK